MYRDGKARLAGTIGAAGVHGTHMMKAQLPLTQPQWNDRLRRYGATDAFSQMLKVRVIEVAQMFAFGPAMTAINNIQRAIAGVSVL